VSERFQFVPSEKAKIAEPAAPLEKNAIMDGPVVTAEGAFATVYVVRAMTPTKPFVEVTGPENVVLAILVPFA
tara:strand:- start:56 stop:274 length:219 start_codon:yes stop_codon:yes gene_type:complete